MGELGEPGSPAMHELVAVASQPQQIFSKIFCTSPRFHKPKKKSVEGEKNKKKAEARWRSDITLAQKEARSALLRAELASRTKLEDYVRARQRRAAVRSPEKASRDDVRSGMFRIRRVLQA